MAAKKTTTTKAPADKAKKVSKAEATAPEAQNTEAKMAETAKTEAAQVVLPQTDPGRSSKRKKGAKTKSASVSPVNAW